MAKEKKHIQESIEPFKGISDEKRKQIELALKKCEKTFGSGCISRIGDKPLENIEVISTGSLSVDKILGVGGLPRGRIIEVWGAEASGKCLTSDSYILTANQGLKTIKE